MNMCIDAADRIETALDAGTLLRKEWTSTDEQGREMACLLAQAAPECGEEETAAVCPAELMPQWLAELTPWFDDSGTLGAWPGMVRRYAGLMRRWHVLTDEDWRRLDYACRAVVVREARSHTDDAKVLETVDGVLALLDRAATGDDPAPREWPEAAEAAAADRITAGMLDAIEAAIERAEGCKEVP